MSSVNQKKPVPQKPADKKKRNIIIAVVITAVVLAVVGIVVGVSVAN